jgi:hypothetical protein
VRQARIFVRPRDREAAGQVIGRDRDRLIRHGVSLCGAMRRLKRRISSVLL